MKVAVNREPVEIEGAITMNVDIQEPAVRKDDILFLPDKNFNSNRVCIVTGSASGIGRATAIAAAANKIMTVGLDVK